MEHSLFDITKQFSNQEYWYTPLILVPKKQRQISLYECEASLVNIARPGQSMLYREGI